MNVHQLLRKPKLKTSKEEAPIVCFRDGQLKSNKEDYNSSNEQSNTACTRNNENKNCQAEVNIDMWPVKPQMDVQLKKPTAKLQSSYKKRALKHMYEDKKCQDTMCEHDDSKSQSARNSDKNCQKNENIEMRPNKLRSHMQLVTIQIIGGYPNQQYHMSMEDCARTRIANLPDVIPNITRTVNCNLNL